MCYNILSTTILPIEAQGCSEDRFPALSGLDGAGSETTTIANSFNVIQDWRLGVTGKDEIAVHAMDSVIARHSKLRSCKALCDCSAAKDATCVWRMPDRTDVGKNILSQRKIRMVSLVEVILAAKNSVPTGPISTTGVNSKSFSMGARFGSGGGT